MGYAYKNMWSLNTDEAVVTGILRGSLPKGFEVLMPMNAQLKDVDLVVMNLANRKTCTIQVKGSRTYEPSKKDLISYSAGSGGWWFLKENTIKEASADYFIFLLYVLEDMKESGRRVLSPHSVTIPTSTLQELTFKHKRMYANNYSYYFWINPKSKEVFDTRDETYFVSEYLDERGYSKMVDALL